MKTIQEMIEIMKAYEDGKQIQYYGLKGGWTDTSKPLFSWGHCDYRIKPEPKEPTYRPYENIGEMLCDYNRRVCKTNNRPKNTLPLIWVKFVSKERYEHGLQCLIGGFDKTANEVYVCGYGWRGMANLFDYFAYLDGTPCGKLV